MRPVFRAVLALSLVTLIAAVVQVGGALKEGEDALIARRPADAVTALRRALDEEPIENRDRVLLLLGRAQELAGDLPGAIASYDRLLRDLPDADLADRARLERAEALVRARRMQEAADAYRTQIDRLTGPQRKEEIAQTYLGLADRALVGDPPDPARAVVFYDLAVDLGLATDRARAVRLLAAQAMLKANNAADAIRRLEPLVKELAGRDEQRRARLLLGDAFHSQGDVARARATYRDLIGAAPDSNEAADASFKIAETFGVPNPGAGRLDLAIAALRAFAERYPSHEKARIAEFLVARSYLSANRSEDALTALRAFLEAHGDEAIDDVAAARALVGDVLAAQGRLDEAIDAWRTYLSAHAAHSEWERVQRAIVDTEFLRAERAVTDEQYEIARTLYADFVRDHPLDGRNADIVRRVAETYATEKKWDDARLAFERCVKKYPGRDESSAAQFRIGEIYEGETFDYQKALDAYKAVTWGSHQGAAQARIRRLEQKAVSLRTLRTFRSGEPAGFQLTARNVPEVRVRVYRLDLETWFRSTHLPGSVERLDIEVIASDKTFASKVSEYVPYRETVRDVPIGFDQPGAYVVKVDDQEREATTLVLVTDLALIVKSSRDELLAFTQNLKEDRVEAGVKVVVSDGEKILTEGQTDARGMFRWKGQQLADAQQLRVFTVDAAGSGAGTLDLSALVTSEGLADRAWLCSDRPAYLPGEVVHVKAIVREVKDGLYVLPTAKADERIRFVSPSGRLVQEVPVEFTDFGTLATDLALPPEAELGNWRVTIDRGPGKQSSVEFEVARFELPRLLLAVEPKQSIVFRGEKIEGNVSLRHFYGEPARDRRVDLVLVRPDGSQESIEGTTNAEGHVAFSFETTEFTEESYAFLTAKVAEDGLSVSAVVPVVTTEFAPSLTTLRDVFLAGQTFDVDVRITDRSGAPLAKGGEVVLLRRETGRRGVSEIEVARKPFRTAGETGKGSVQFAAQKGGEHVLRVQATDRFGQVVTAEKVVTISGEDDQLKLRILVDRQSWRVGETVEARIVNRAGEHLALRTLQADGILACEAVRIPAGESVLRLPLEGRHAPNFALAFAMIDGTDLREATTEFFVARDLAISITPPAAVATPGSEIEVVVETKDAHGRPVVGEIAIAMVESGLFQLYAERTADLTETFWGMRRQTAFNTVSSCGWSYDGPSRAVSQALLAEELRMLEEAERTMDRAPDSDAPADALSDARRFDRGRQPSGGGPVTAGPSGPSTPGPGRAGRPTAGEGREQLGQQQAEQSMRFSQDEKESAFDSNAWNSAVGLGGGAGRRVGGNIQVLANKQLELHSMFAKTAIAFDVFSVGGAWDGTIALPHLTAQPRTSFTPGGAWISSVVTDASGRATVKVRMPEASTEWTLVGRGATRDTDVGSHTAKLRTARDLVAELSAPAFLVGGDESVVRARLHHRAAGAVDLTVRTTRGDLVDERAMTLGAGEESSFELPLLAPAEGALPIVLDADGAHAARRELGVPILPFGVELRDGRSGTLSDAARFTLGLTQGRDVRDLAMTVELVLGADAGLAAAALAPGASGRNCRVISPTNVTIASRAIAALVALAASDGDGNRAERAALSAAAEGAISSLVSAQRQDGGFGWIGQGQPDLQTTAVALRALRRAQTRGNAAARPAAERAERWIAAALRGVRDEDRIDPERALAASGQQRFEALNALHRRRASFDLAGLGRLALAWREANRPELAAEVDTLAKERLAVLKLRPGDDAKVVGDDPSLVAAVARVTESLLRGSVSDPVAAELVRWLDSRRVGPAWSTAEATAAAIEALAHAVQRDRRTTGEATAIELRVNGEPIPVTLPATLAGTVAIVVPTGRLQTAGNVVELTLHGSGLIRYSALLGGFARDFVPADRNRELVQVRRAYRPAFLRDDGKVVQPGFGVVTGRHETYENELKQLAVGATARVETSFWISGNEPENSPILPLVVEEPIPAGCTVPRTSIQGAFEQIEVLPDRIVAWYRAGVRADTLRYELIGRFPGKYRALPTVVAGASRPDLSAFGPAGAIEVLARDAASTESYRMTPDELWTFGKSAFEKKDHAGAKRLLEQLAAGWTLRADVLRDLARMMLFVSIAQSDSRATVKWFEEVKDRYPELVIPFEDIRAVGGAYMDIGEFEAAVLVYRGTTEASYLKDAAVASTLERLGEVQASVRFLRGLLDTYPGLNTMRQSLYGIGQQLGLLAGGMRAGQRVDPKVGSRALLYRQANEVLREFLVLYSDDPLAEEVTFAWATTLIEAGELQSALDVALGALARAAGSSMEDEFLYTAGYARFVLGNPDEALAAVRRVASEAFPKRSGGPGPSENQKHAIYLEGQIYHALGRAADALASYDRVVEDFQDASEATEYFREKDLSLAEVTRFPLGAEAKLELKWRNVEKADVKVYKVDLMRLYLLHKSLDNVRGIMLHGIRPLFETAVDLGEGKDYLGERKSEIVLPLVDAGAYLVVVRAGDLLASGLVLRSDLEIDVQESLDIGRVRVNLKRKGVFVPGGHVKVVGSGDGELRSGETDPRGIFVADGLVGRATVIAQVDDSYAFVRGTGIHQPARFRPAPDPEAQQRDGGQQLERKGKAFDGWENNLRLNNDNRARQVQWLQEQVKDKKQEGVEVYRAK